MKCLRCEQEITKRNHIPFCTQRCASQNATEDYQEYQWCLEHEHWTKEKSAPCRFEETKKEGGWMP